MTTSPADQIGQYELIRTLGKGATATVYLARDLERGLDVALKVVSLAGSSKAISRRLQKLFLTESKVARRLDHPGIVRVHAAVVEADRAYLALEYVPGQSLDSFVQIDRLLPVNRVIDIVFKCCLALDYAYRQGVVHRDIKPANILLDAAGNPKIADFGLALFLQKNVATDSTFVMGVGSPAYMSPEQIKDYPLDQKTDLYSLGVVLFQLLTGRLPYRGGSQAALIYHIINAEVPAVTAINPRLPKVLDDVLRKALAKDLWSRYDSGAEFGRDLMAARYQIVDEGSPGADSAAFEVLRQLAFFADFDDIEVWETLRIARWRELPATVTLIEAGATDRLFGLVVSGTVEVSIAGKRIARLGPGEVVGEMGFLDPKASGRQASVVTVAPVRFLEINAAALALASDELQTRFRNSLITVVLDRLRQANQTLAAQGTDAVAGSQPPPDSTLIDLPPIDFGTSVLPDGGEPG